MSLLIDADTEGYKRAVASALKQYKDIKPQLSAIGDYLELTTDERFDKQRAPNGRRWAALSSAYAKRKAKDPRKKKSAGILELTGGMRRSIKKTVGKTSVEIGPTKSATPFIKLKAGVHQYGSPSRNIPARPFLGLTAEDKKEILGILSLPPERLAGPKNKKKK
jgi:phage virion morphogenesis protein